MFLSNSVDMMKNLQWHKRPGSYIIDDKSKKSGEIFLYFLFKAYQKAGLEFQELKTV